jgi:hypothetical protein
VSSRETAPDTDILQHSALLHVYDNLPSEEWPPQWQPSEDFPTPQSVGDDEFRKTANDALSFSGEPVRYKLGDQEVALAPYRNYLEDLTRDNQTILLATGLGGGKSSQGPLWKLEEYLRTGSDKNLYVTSPRKLPTHLLQQRVQDFLPPELKHLVGRQTGNAEESDCHPDARIIFGTERLLYKKLMSGEIRLHDDIMIDEAHEATTPMTFFAAYVKRMLPQTPDRQIIIASGSLDDNRWAKYLANPATGLPAPIVSMDTRNFPHEFIISEKLVHEVARERMELGHNVLVFEPGEARMNDTASRMSYAHAKESSLKTSTIHLLNGSMSPAEQAEALNPADGHHLVANKVAETSVTPDGKDDVVSSGTSNIGMYEEGEHILATVHTSKAALKQQGGRVSRTKAGTHILAVANNAPPIAYEDRPDFDPPEIQSECIASEIAETLTGGIRPEDLPLLYSPSERNLHHDYGLLRHLGAIAREGTEDVVTKTGHAMLGLGIDMPQARSIVEARSIEDGTNVSAEAVRLQACAIAAIQQENGILQSWNNGERRQQLEQGIKNGLSEERSSDVLFELDAFVTAYNLQRREMGGDDPNPTIRFERMLRARDIKLMPYYKALSNFRELCRREGLNPEGIEKPTDEERRELLRCQIVGAEELFARTGGSWYSDRRGKKRQLGVRSTIWTEDPMVRADIVVGQAFTIRGMTDRGRFERRYIAGGSVIKNPEDIKTYAPHRVTEKTIGYGITEDGEIRERSAWYFDGVQPFHVTPGELSPTLDTRRFLIRAMMTGASLPTFKGDKLAAYQPTTTNARRALRRWRNAQDIENRTDMQLNVDARYESLINKIVRESVEKVPLAVTDPSALDNLIPRVYPHRLVRPSRQGQINEILGNAPDCVTINFEDGSEGEVLVAYKNGTAFVNIPPSLMFKVKREDFADLTAHHGVKIRMFGGEYKYLDTAFEQIDMRRLEYERKKARRAELRAAAGQMTEEEVFEAKKWRLKRNAPKPVTTEPDKVPNAPKINKRQAKKFRKREDRSKRRTERQNSWAASAAS